MKPRGLVTKLQPYQNQSLRIVAGAYKATPIRLLETETPHHHSIYGSTAVQNASKLDLKGQVSHSKFGRHAKQYRNVSGAVGDGKKSRRSSRTRRNGGRHTTVE
jgi:hypothetical protein